MKTPIIFTGALLALAACEPVATVSANASADAMSGVGVEVLNRDCRLDVDSGVGVGVGPLGVGFDGNVSSEEEREILLRVQAGTASATEQEYVAECIAPSNTDT